jgi:hypothetical protein
MKKVGVLFSDEYNALGPQWQRAHEGKECVWIGSRGQGEKAAAFRT